jgi:ElaA protein
MSDTNLPEISYVLRWQWTRLEQLSALELYRILRIRSEIFVVEQTCIYQDMDGLDVAAEHLIAWSDTEVAAYLRVLAPGTRFAERSIGRVITAPAHRGTGIGRTLMTRALDHLDTTYPHEPIRISAQSHLARFYGSLGFSVDSAEYLEDGIPHMEMLRRR